MRGPSEPKDGYPEPDANGMYRLPIERSFKVSYTRSGGSVGSAFALPTLVAGVDAKLESRYYADLDIMPVEGSSVAVAGPLWTFERIAVAGIATALAAALATWWVRRRRTPVAVAAPSWTPARITPLGVVTGLRRLEQGLPAEKAKALRDEIVLLELKYFGPNAAETSEAELRSVIDKWARNAV